MTYKLRRAMAIIIKQQIETGIDTVRRIRDEYLLKDLAERQGFVEEIGREI